MNQNGGILGSSSPLSTAKHTASRMSSRSPSNRTQNYEIEVRDAKPGRAISVIETDCQVRRCLEGGSDGVRGYMDSDNKAAGGGESEGMRGDAVR